MRSKRIPKTTATSSATKNPLSIAPKPPRKPRVKKTVAVTVPNVISPPPAPATTASTAAAIAMTTASTVSQTTALVFNSLMSFLSFDAVVEDEGKKGRKKFGYEKNISASLSLQHMPEKTSHKKGGTTSLMYNALQTGAQSLGSAMLSTGSSLLSSAGTLISGKTKVPATPAPAAPVATVIAEPEPAEVKEDPFLADKALTKKIMELQQEIIQLTEALEKKTSAKVRNPKEEKKYQNEIERRLLAQVNLVEQQIKEHAARRVDLFFYLLTAVYNQKVDVTKGDTTLQHGSGTTVTGTQACHSSMIPNPELTLKPSTYNTYFRRALTLENTHFMHSLNTTVQLPKLANQFDCNLESVRLSSGAFRKSKYMDKALYILNRAAMGEIDPITGINEFINVLKTFFNSQYRKFIEPTARAKALANGVTLIEYSEAYAKVWELQKRGTFSACKIPFLVNRDSYIDNILKTPLDSEKKPQADVDPLDKLIVGDDYIHVLMGNRSMESQAGFWCTPHSFRYTGLQKEILETKEEITPSRRSRKP